MVSLTGIFLDGNEGRRAGALVGEGGGFALGGPLAGFLLAWACLARISSKGLKSGSLAIMA